MRQAWVFLDIVMKKIWLENSFWALKQKYPNLRTLEALYAVEAGFEENKDEVKSWPLPNPNLN